jgi:hypothetical protein
MNERLRILVKETRLDVYSLGGDRERWEYIVERFAKLVLLEFGDEMYIPSERVDKTQENEHEPVDATAFECPRCGHCCREWVGLTDEDIWQLRREGAQAVSDKDFKAIEAKLKEKNT